MGIEQLENALGCGHGRLHEVVFFAQILNGPEESQAVLKEGHHDADLKRASTHAKSAVGEQQRQRQHSEKLRDGIKPAIGDDRVFVGFHVVAIDLFEVAAAARLPIEQLQHGNSSDVLL
jgi:hypothetical protein